MKDSDPVLLSVKYTLSFEELQEVNRSKFGLEAI